MPRRLQECEPFDDVLVALHGAMVAETDQERDSRFLCRIRAVVRHDIPLAITMGRSGNWRKLMRAMHSASGIADFSDTPGS